MLRWLLLTVLVVAISAAAAWFSLSVPEGESLGNGVAFPTLSAGEAKENGPAPLLVIDAPTRHEFGIMSQQAVGNHEWIVRNSGPGDLILEGTEPTCACTVADPKPNQEVVVKAGESYTVKVKWETRLNSGKYEKSASVRTNDPERPEVSFTVSGVVQPAIITMPEDGIINVSNVPNDQPRTFNALVASPDRPDMKITNIRSTRPEAVEVSIEPLTKEDLNDFMMLEAGHKILITVKPTNTLGPFQEEILIETDHPIRKDVKLTVAGRVVGPITITPSAGIRVTESSGSRARSSSAILSVRGQASTQFTATKVPENLKVAITPVDDHSQASTPETMVRRYRLTVEVAEETPPGIIDDPIKLATDHPMASEVEVPVYVRVLGGP